MEKACEGMRTMEMACEGLLRESTRARTKEPRGQKETRKEEKA